MKVPSTLLEDPAPFARLVPPRAQAASTHPRARPRRLKRLPWPRELASGRPKGEGSSTVRDQAGRLAIAKQGPPEGTEVPADDMVLAIASPPTKAPGKTDCGMVELRDNFPADLKAKYAKLPFE